MEHGGSLPMTPSGGEEPLQRGLEMKQLFIMGLVGPKTYLAYCSPL
jgi:hypothetical protein